jgi:hypothetical protein
MSMWTRIGIAVGLTPIIVHAQTNNPFSALYPLILSMFDLFSLRWVPASMQGYAAKAIIFIAFAVLIHYGLNKFGMPNRVAITISISIAALGIIFFPDNLEMAGGGNFGLLFGLIILGLPIVALIYMLFKIVHNKVQTPAFKHLSYGGICLIGYSMLASSMNFMGYSPHTSQESLLSGIAQGLAFLGLVGLLYIITGVVQLFSGNSWKYEGPGDPNLFSRDEERDLHKESNEDKRKRKLERSFHKEMYSAEKRRSGIASKLYDEINDIVRAIEDYLQHPNNKEKAFQKVAREYGSFKEKYNSLIKDLREEHRNFNEYIRLERTRASLTDEQKNYINQKERNLTIESKAIQALAENAGVFFRKVDDLLRADRSDVDKLKENIQTIKDEVLKIRTVIEALQQAETREERIEELQGKIDSAGAN